MKSTLIPKKLEEWEFETVDELTKYTDIESETFDFKKEPSDLHEDICAMANTQEGVIVLGISQIDSEDGKKILRFEKTGFELGEEDTIKNTVGNYAVKVEPLPVFDMKPVYDKKNNRFFMVIKIESKITDRPYFIKTTDQCFVRIHNSSRRVGRSVILSLYAGGLEKKTSVERLYASTNLFKESFLHTVDDLQNATGDWQQKVGVLDLTFIKNAIISAQWFLEENDLLGKKIPQGYTMGFNDKLYKLERLNAYIRFYNDQSDPEPKKQMKSQFYEWSLGHSNHTDMIEFFDKVMKTASDFLAKFK